MRSAPIPRFFLYGEAPKSVADRFLHLESLDDRTRPANWNIRPHTHAGLHHIFFIHVGGGRMLVDDRSFEFEAPSLLIVPAGAVHGFEYVEDTRGAVLTVSADYFDDLAKRCADLRALFTQAAALPCHDTFGLDETLDRLRRELSWTAPGHGLSIEASLSTLLVEALRLSHHADRDEPASRGPRTALVAQFRALIEANYRDGTSVEDYASQLGVTAKRLRSACQVVADTTPSQLIQDRVLLEAKRLLLYSNMTVAEAAFYLGFDDPAYFTRVFTRACGDSPRRFRAKTRPEGAV
jgi:AraC family transcriptional activator of pobA